MKGEYLSKWILRRRGSVATEKDNILNEKGRAVVSDSAPLITLDADFDGGGFAVLLIGALFVFALVKARRDGCWQ